MAGHGTPRRCSQGCGGRQQPCNHYSGSPGVSKEMWRCCLWNVWANVGNQKAFLQLGWVIKCQSPSLAESLEVRALSDSQLGRKRFNLRQNMQKHSEEPLGLAEFGETVSSTKSFSLPGSQWFQPHPRPLLTRHLITQRLFCVQLCPICLTLPQAAAPFLLQSPSKSPPAPPHVCRTAEGWGGDEWRSATSSSSFSLSVAQKLPEPRRYARIRA